jgi:phosphohistidine phosphatase SixA
MHTAMTLYSTEQGYLSDLFEALPNQTDRILIVGHNPVISGLGRWLADGADFPEFEPAHAAVFRIDVAHWRDIHPSLAVLTARLSPGG